MLIGRFWPNLKDIESLWYLTFVPRLNQILSIGTEIWFWTDKKCGQTRGRRQNYIPLSSSGDNKQNHPGYCNSSLLASQDLAFANKTVWTQIRTNRTEVLTWIQTAWHSNYHDYVPEYMILSSADFYSKLTFSKNSFKINILLLTFIQN